MVLSSFHFEFWQKNHRNKIRSIFEVPLATIIEIENMIGMTQLFLRAYIPSTSKIGNLSFQMVSWSYRNFTQMAMADYILQTPWIFSYKNITKVECLKKFKKVTCRNKYFVFWKLKCFDNFFVPFRSRTVRPIN